MKNVLICGATGFIGRNCVNYFSSKKEYQVYALCNKRPPFDVKNAVNKVIWRRGNLLELQDCISSLKGIDIVIQAAATTSGSKDIVNQPYLHVTDNAIMNSLLLRQSMEQGIKHFIFFSCTVMYQSSANPIKESDWDQNKELYKSYFGVGNTKIYIEKMLEFYSRISPMKTTAIRHSNIYGPYDKFDLERSHFFGATVSKVMQASKSILMWGTGEEKRDLLYVDDLMSFLDKVIDKQPQKFRLYNCGLGIAHSVKSIVDLIVRLSGKELSVDQDLSKPSIKTSLALDCSLAKEELGWKPEVEIADGIDKTLNWWKKNIDPSTLHPLQP